jgi:hypothetical protein
MYFAMLTSTDKKGMAAAIELTQQAALLDVSHK